MNSFETELDREVREVHEMQAGLRALGLSEMICHGNEDGYRCWQPIAEGLERVKPDRGYEPHVCRWCHNTPLTQKQRRKLIAASQQVVPEWDDKIYTHEAQAEHGTVLCQHREEHAITAVYIAQKGRSESLGLVYSCGARDRGDCLEQRQRFAELGPLVRLYRHGGFGSRRSVAGCLSPQGSAGSRRVTGASGDHR